MPRPTSLVLLLGLTACEEPDRLRYHEVTSSVVVELRGDPIAREQKDYFTRVQKEIADVEQQISVLEAQASAAPGATKDQQDDGLAEVRAKRDALLEDLRAIETSNDSNWNLVRSRIDRDLSELRDSVKRASRRPGETPRGP